MEAGRCPAGALHHFLRVALGARRLPVSTLVRFESRSSPATPRAVGQPTRRRRSTRPASRCRISRSPASTS